MTNTAPIERDATVSDSSLRTQVEQVLDAMRPIIQQDGGDIELVSVSEEGAVVIEFQGACVGCPSRSLTLQSLIDRNLRQYVPGFSSISSKDA